MILMTSAGSPFQRCKSLKVMDFSVSEHEWAWRILTSHFRKGTERAVPDLLRMCGMPAAREPPEWCTFHESPHLLFLMLWLQQGLWEACSEIHPSQCLGINALHEFSGGINQDKLQCICQYVHETHTYIHTYKCGSLLTSPLPRESCEIFPWALEQLNNWIISVCCD